MSHHHVHAAIMVEIPERNPIGEHQPCGGQAALGVEGPVAPAVAGEEEEALDRIAHGLRGVAAR
jgi:hypothetical protein